MGHKLKFKPAAACPEFNAAFINVTEALKVCGSRPTPERLTVSPLQDRTSHFIQTLWTRVHPRSGPGGSNPAEFGFCTLSSKKETEMKVKGLQLQIKRSSKFILGNVSGPAVVFGFGSEPAACKSVFVKRQRN